jgi:hypothetical protein
MALRFLNNGYFAGKVGIGTESPAYKLHAKGTVNGNLNIAVENDSTGTDAYSSYRLKHDSIDTAVMFLTGSNNTNYAGASSLNMYQGTSLPLGFVTNNLLRMIVAGDGNVGINTTSPGAKLEIQTLRESAIILSSSDVTAGADVLLSAIDFYSNDTGNEGVKASIQVKYGDVAANSYMTLNTGGNTEQVRITKLGNVGIGTISPNQRLDVAGNVVIPYANGYFMDTVGAAASNFIKTVNSFETVVGTDRGSAGFGVFGNSNIRLGFGTDYTTAQTKLTLNTNGLIQFNAYNLTNQTGTPTYMLGTDASGNVVKVLGGDIPGGGGTVTGTGVTGEVAYWTSSTNIANNAGMSFSNEQLQIDGIGGADGFVLPYDENPGYSNMSAGGFGILFREAQDNYITGNAYWYKTGGVAGWRAKYDAQATQLSQASGEFNFHTAPANGANGALTFTSRMIIKQSGNVGIGTPSPAAPLHVLDDSSANVLAKIRIQGDSTSGYGDIGMQSGYIRLFSNGSMCSAWTGGVQYNYINGSTATTLTSTGFGIGVTSPGAKLDIVGSSLGIRVKKADLSDVLRVYTQGSGIFMDNGNVHISDDLKIGATLLSNQENTDIDSAAAEVVAQVSITDYTAAFFDFVVKKGTNVRSGTVYACHDGTNVEFTETSTNDLGDTSDVTLSVDKTSTNLRLIATVTSDDWSVKSLIRAI